MRFCVFDLETSSLHANSGIILCAAIKQYEGKKIEIIRADDFKTWKRNKTDESEMIKAITKSLEPYDAFICHNGTRFDKPWISSVQLKYGLRPSLRFEKFIDPVSLAWRHLRLARNSLAALIDYFDIPVNKTPIRFKYWLEASLNGDSKALTYIADHCIADVRVLELVYTKVMKLIKDVNEKGSAF